MSDELRHQQDQDIGADTERFRKFARSDESPTTDEVSVGGGLPVGTLTIVLALAVVLVLLAIVLLR